MCDSLSPEQTAIIATQYARDWTINAECLAKKTRDEIIAILRQFPEDTHFGAYGNIHLRVYSRKFELDAGPITVARRESYIVT